MKSKHIISICHCERPFWTRGNPLNMNAACPESGRSMVEMLGVLAIIGVLTVGGVAGYNFAMTRYRANEIIESVKQRATVGSGQYLQGMEAINLSEFPSTILEYETEGFDEGLNGEKDLFSIDVKEVPQAVCQDILDRNWTWPAGIFVNERAIPCPEGNSKMTFVFAADLNERIDAEAYDPCWGKTCCRTTDPNTLAFEEGQNLSNKECQKTAANNLTCCTTANTRQCYFDQASIDRYGPHQNTIADCTNDGLHRCDGDLNCVCTTGCTNPDKVQNPNTCACACPTGVPNANDNACVECLADTDCTGGKVCNMADNTCKCPETGTAPTNTCYTTTEHAATEACPAYTTYEPLTCTEPKTECDLANNTCKCPDCQNPGQVADSDTCACSCPTGVPNADNTACVECVNDTDCTGDKVCNTANNTCKCPACPATGMTQNADTCECNCPSGKRFNAVTKKCETDCLTTPIPTIPAKAKSFHRGHGRVAGLHIESLGPYACSYVVSGCVYLADDRVAYTIDGAWVYTYVGYNYSCYSDSCGHCWSTELPAGKELKVLVWNGGKHNSLDYRGSMYLSSKAQNATGQGNYLSSDGSRLTDNCAAGEYARYGECTICPKGSYCVNNQKYACDPSKGEYADKTGATACLICPDLKYTTNGITCTSCPSGYKCENGIKIACKASEGYIGKNGVCSRCEETKYAKGSNDIGTSCAKCPNGKTCAGGKVVG